MSETEEKIHVPEGRFGGLLFLPGSKSYAIRAFALALLAKGRSIIKHVSDCDDNLAAFRIVENLGAGLRRQKDWWFIEGGALNLAEEAIDAPFTAGESGLTLRLFSALFGLYDQPLRLEATGGLSARPMHFIEKPMADLGVHAKTTDGFAPITIHGEYQGGETVIDASITSQFLSGLLIALPVAKGHYRLQVENLRSKPYVEMTLEIIKQFGGKIQHDENLSGFIIEGGQSYQPQDYFVESDWSAAANFLVAASLRGDIHTHSIRKDSKQADILILDILEKAGAMIEQEGESLSVKARLLKGFTIDLTDSPDLFPPAVALACHCNTKSRLKGVHRLRHKETDRAKALTEEFGKLGAKIEIEDDVMIIHPGLLRHAEVHARGDHRIAMALASAAVKTHGGVTIHGHECVKKSYPSFFERFFQNLSFGKA